MIAKLIFNQLNENEVITFPVSLNMFAFRNEFRVNLILSRTILLDNLLFSISIIYSQILMCR